MLLAALIFRRFAARHWSEDVETNPPDVVGIGLLLVGIAALQVTLSRGETDDWFGSPFICGMALAALLCNLSFVVWQLLTRNRHPLLNLGFLRDRGLLSAAVLGTILGMLLAGSLYAVPQYLRRVESRSAPQTGQLMSISGIASLGVLLFTPTMARMICRFGGKLVMMTALAAQMVSMGLLGYRAHLGYAGQESLASLGA